MWGCDLIADRFFVDDGGRWRDLASGEYVEIVWRVVDRQWVAWERALADEWHDGRPGRLIDFGRTGADGWFEARLKDRRRAAIDAGAEAAITEAIDCAVREGASCAHVGNGTRPAAVTVRLVAARALRLAGYVPMRASLSIPSRVEGMLRHRHVAFLTCADRDRSPTAARWWRLASITPRRHLVIDCRATLDAPAGPWSV